LLAFGQRPGLLDDAGLVGFGQRRAQGRQPFPFRRRLFRAQFRIGGHGQPDPVRVVQQQLPGESRDEIDVPAFDSELLQQRIAVQRRQRVAAVDRRGQRFHQQAQAVGEAVASDFALAQFQLMEGGVHRILRHALGGDLSQHVEHQRLDRPCVFGVGTLQPTDEGGLAGGGVETAQRRRRGAEFGGFQGVAQRRTAVVQQHVAQQPRPQGRQRVGDRSQQPAQHDMRLIARVFGAIQGIVDQVDDRRGMAALVEDGQVELQGLELI